MRVAKYRIKCKRNQEFLTKIIEDWYDQELFIVCGAEVLFGARFYNHNKNIVSLEFFNHSEYCGTTDCENSQVNGATPNNKRIFQSDPRRRFRIRPSNARRV